MAYSVSKSKVVFSAQNVRDCMCGKCPVQSGSACTKQSLEKLANAMANGELPKKDDIPKLFCSTGSIPCKDIDVTQECICGNCVVWYKYMLAKEKPMTYYCRQKRR